MLGLYTSSIASRDAIEKRLRQPYRLLQVRYGSMMRVSLTLIDASASVRRHHETDADRGKGPDDQRCIGQGRRHERQADTGDATREGNEGQFLIHAFRYAHWQGAALIWLKAGRRETSFA